jgi:hypothetical protein
LTQTKGRGYEIDPGRVREYFWRLLGGEEMELRVLRVEGILGNTVVKEPHSKIEREEIDLFLRKAKNGKAVGKDGYTMEFWKEIIKNEEVGKMKTAVQKAFDTVVVREACDGNEGGRVYLQNL